MFWRRTRSADVLPRAVEPKGTSDDSATETVGALLRLFGQHALELPDLSAVEVARIFDGWARHLLVGAPHPLRGDGAPNTRNERDWIGLRQYFRDHRKKEAEHAARGLSELRGLIWTFVDRMAKNLPEEARFESETKGQMERLKKAVEARSIDAISKEALSTVSFLERALAQKNEQRRAEVELLSTRIQALRAQLEDARHDSETDPLTQLVNRRGFEAQLDRAAVMSALVDQKSTLILFDIDHFKHVNDTYGHPGGDAALVAVAKRMARAFPRKMDCVARFGGEEFAVLLCDSGGSDGLRLAERCLGELRQLEVPCGNRAIYLTVSAGVAEHRRGEQMTEWIARADAALYRAKEGGRDRAMIAP